MPRIEEKVHIPSFPPAIGRREGSNVTSNRALSFTFQFFEFWLRACNARVLLAGDSENALMRYPYIHVCMRVYMIHWTTYYEKRSVERSLARSTVARSRVYLARGPRLLRCGSRSRFSRTEANPRFRIPRCRISRRPSGPLSTPLSPFRDYLLPPETLDKQSTQNYATLRNRTTLETTGNVMDNRDIATRMNCTRLRRSSSISSCSKITIILLFSVYLSKWRSIQRVPFFLCCIMHGLPSYSRTNAIFRSIVSAVTTVVRTEMADQGLFYAI